MKKTLVSLAAVAAAALLPAQSLTTTLTSNNGQAGNMFDVKALVGLTIDSFDVNLDAGTWDLEVYALPSNTPYLPDVNNAAAWGSPIASVTGVVSNGFNVATPLNLALGLPVPAGSIQAFYITVTNGTAMNYTNGSTTGNLYASNAELEFYEGSGLAYPFTANFNPRVWNGTIYYTSAPGQATKQVYGSSCDFPSQFGELFAQGDPVDLANTSWTMTDNGNGTWSVAAGGLPFDAAGAQAAGTDITDPNAPWVTYTSSSSASWDDATLVLTPAAGPFSYPDAAAGGSALAAQISINTNGSIRFGDQGADNSFAFNGGNGNVAAVFGGSAGPGLPNLAPFFNDLNPDIAGGGGGVIWIEDNVGGGAGGLRVTWDSVPNWDAGAGIPAELNDLQVTILPGLIFLAFGPNVGNGGSAGNAGIVGWSQGDSSADNRVDWTVDMTGYTSGTGYVGPSTDATAAPIYGTTTDLTVSGLSPTAVLGGFVLGFNELNPGINLSAVAEVDCDLLVSVDQILPAIPAAGVATASLPIPNNTALQGLEVNAQGFALDTALVGPLGGEFNPGGATLGNAVKLTIGS